MSRKKVIVIAGLIAIALAAGGIYFRSEGDKKENLVFSGTVETHEVQVGSKVGGRISELPAVEGQTAKAGDVLVRFDVSELIAERSGLEARIAQAEAYLKKMESGYRKEEITQADAAAGRESAALEALRNGPRPQEISEVKAKLTAEKANLETAQVTFQRLQSLHESGFVSSQERDEAANNVEKAKGSVSALQQQLSLLEAGTRSEDIKAAEERYRQAQANAQMLRSGYRSEDISDARAKLNEARAALEQVNVQISEGEIKAPVDARIEVVSVRPGDLVPAGKPVIKLLEQDQVWVRIYVPEPFLGNVHVGQTASISVDTFPGREFPGSIEQISNQAEFTPRNVQSRSERNHQVFGVKVAIENKDGAIKSGMAADVKLAVK